MELEPIDLILKEARSEQKFRNRKILLDFVTRLMQESVS
jgi:hypothetical protein